MDFLTPVEPEPPINPDVPISQEGVYQSNPYKQEPEEDTEIPVIYPEDVEEIEEESEIPLGDQCCLNCYHKFLRRCQIMGKDNLLVVSPGNYCEYWKEKK